MVQLTSAEAAMTTKYIKRGAILLLIIALLAGCTVQNNEGTTDKAPTAAYSEQRETETVVHTTIPETTTVYYTEPATERIDVYYHSCITNSVIYEQDGSDRFSYIDKCDVCGYRKMLLSLDFLSLICYVYLWKLPFAFPVVRGKSPHELHNSNSPFLYSPPDFLKLQMKRTFNKTEIRIFTGLRMDFFQTK